MAAGLGALPRAVARLPGAGRGREPARADGPASGGRWASPSGSFSPWTDRLEEARLLHLFGMSREGLELARVAQARGVRVVLSPICWFEPRAIAALAPEPGASGLGPGEVVRQAASRPRWPSWRRDLLALADAILPNSRGRGPPARPALRRRPAADPRRAQRRRADVRRRGSPALFRSRYGDGRLRALRRPDRAAEERAGPDPRRSRPTGLPLVVIGDAPPGHEAYAEACRRAGGGRRPLARRRSTTTTRCWPRPMRRPGSSPCRAGSRRRAWPRWRRPWRAARW